MDNFDSYNVLLAIATNIPVLLMTAFVLQGHTHIYIHAYLSFDVMVWYGFGTAGGETIHKIDFFKQFNYNKNVLRDKNDLSLCSKLQLFTLLNNARLFQHNFGSHMD